MEICILFWQVDRTSFEEVVGLFEYVIKEAEAAFVQETPIFHISVLLCQFDMHIFTTSYILFIAFPKEWGMRHMFLPQKRPLILKEVIQKFVSYKCRINNIIKTIKLYCLFKFNLHATFLGVLETVLAIVWQIKTTSNV